MTVDRPGLERRVDELAATHSGREFASAIQTLAAGLDPDGVELLKRILLERGATFDQAVMERVDARGWFRRQWDSAGRR